MGRSLLDRAAGFLLEQRRRKRWQKAVCGMAAVVVFCTTYALILPAITMSSDTICGMEEHVHTEECYTTELRYPQSSMACTLDAGGAPVIHTHDRYCYSEDGTLICQLPELEAHRHTSRCYREVRTLLCEEEEDPGHEHTAACYARHRGELICTEEKDPGHTHDDSCYDVERELTCEDDSEEHEHDEDCYTETRELTCTEEERPGHTHTDGCYEWTEELTCTEEERPAGHIHTDECYEITEVLDCGEEEVIPHTHDEGCYDESGALTCGMEEVLEHRHTAECIVPPEGDPWEVRVLSCGKELHTHTTDCYPREEKPLPDGTGSGAAETPEVPETPAVPEETEYLCGLEEHTHTEDCYSPEGELTCGLEEHVHSEECLAAAAEKPSEADGAVQAVIDLIDALPDYDEADALLAELDEAGDEEGWTEYYMAIAQQARYAYEQYLELDEEQQALVTNADKLFEFECIWSAVTLEITDTVTVKGVNYHVDSGNRDTMLIYGGSVRDKLGSGMSYTYWDILMVEKGSSGLYVAQYVTTDGDKRDYKPTTDGGFLLLLNGATVATQVGDPVKVSFDYANTAAGYNASGYGTVSFGSEGKQKPAKDNSSKLDTLRSADTSGLIELNLYNYDSRINTLYKSDKRYPGFQQEGGEAKGTSLGGSNFGNNVVEDRDAGIDGVTNAGGAINATTGKGVNGPDGEIGTANMPISGAMQSTLGDDGYPALADGTSLKYLFSNSTYAAKQNSESINGLFLHNDRTGAYTFNSRENHAQFDPGNDTFTLYKQIITPNFTMYPFGNFLPFSDIVHDSAQVSTMNRAYLETIRSSALYKAENGYDNAFTTCTPYGTLASTMGTWMGKMDAAYPDGWSIAEGANQYFQSITGLPNIDFNNNQELLKNTYCVDYDEPKNFFFGMEMKMNFLQPKGGKTGSDGQQDMIFYFTGDDDVWVYVDGVLFLDLSGIHRHVGGEIDFVNGVVKYYALTPATGDVSDTPYETKTFAEILSAAGRSTDGLNAKGTFQDYTTHSFNFYYMERGAGSGVCRLNFNFPLLRQNAISVKKDLTVDKPDKLPLLGDPDFRFQILKAENDGSKTEKLFILPGTPYEVLDANNKPVSGTFRTDDDGVFTLKAGQTAVFDGINENTGKYYVRELLNTKDFEQYGTISVDGSTQTTNYDVTVGGDTFKGLDSTVKDASEGTTAFHFNNQVTFNKLGKLSITKVLEPYPRTRAELTFSFRVTLDGVPLPVGTRYTVGDGTETVTEAGVVTVPAGGTATIPNILSGSQYTVQELSASAAGYTVGYTVDGEDGTVETDGGEQYVAGTIRRDHTVAVAVTNSEKGATAAIPVEKTLKGGKGEAREFSFRLVQVDGTDHTEEVDGTAQVLKITVDGEGRGTGSFLLNYAEPSLETFPAEFWYRVAETDEKDPGIWYDDTAYLVRVTVSKDADGSLTASAACMLEDGTAVTALSFTNTVATYELPETGGTGTGLYALAGTLLMGGAVCLLYSDIRRRKEEHASTS